MTTNASKESTTPRTQLNVHAHMNIHRYTRLCFGGTNLRLQFKGFHPLDEDLKDESADRTQIVRRVGSHNREDTIHAHLLCKGLCVAHRRSRNFLSATQRGPRQHPDPQGVGGQRKRGGDHKPVYIPAPNRIAPETHPWIGFDCPAGSGSSAPQHTWQEAPGQWTRRNRAPPSC